MGLAGNMKLSTFVTAAACTAVLGGTGAFLLWPEAKPEPAAPEPSAVATTAPDTPEAKPEPAAPEAHPTSATSELDALLLDWMGKDLGEPKKKDVTAGKPYKVNLYQDEGQATVNRAKVDLDRDELWDLKVSFGDGGMSRLVSTQDDDVYDLEQRWDGQRWVGALPSPTEDAGALPEELSWMGRDLGAPKLKDVTKGRPYKINVYQDDGHPTANRAKVDLDRDDRWDVVVEYGDPPTRQVSSRDDEVYDLEQSWDGTDWVSP